MIDIKELKQFVFRRCPIVNFQLKETPIVPDSKFMEYSLIKMVDLENALDEYVYRKNKLMSDSDS